jgi:hypothetical protein
MLSFSKILFTVLVVVAAIYGYRLLTRRQEALTKKSEDAVDLVRCPVCGDHVSASAGPCERADCPRR